MEDSMLFPCREWAERLAVYQAGELLPADREALDAHLASCLACRSVLMEYGRLDAGMHQALSVQPPPRVSPALLRSEKEVERVWYHSNGNIDPGTFPLSSSEREGSTLLPIHPSIRRHYPGSFTQTLIAAMIIAALLGTTLLLLRARVPSTPRQPPSIGSSGIMSVVDAQHTHFNPYEHILNPTTVGGLTKKWAYQTGSTLSSPVVADGVVYVGCDCGYVYALDAASGTKKWAYQTGSQVASLPAVAGGLVYIGAYEDHTLYALDAASGTKKWAYRTNGPIESSPAVAGGVVYVGSEDNTLYALDAASGTKKWTYWTRGGIYSSPAVADGVVYVGSSDGNLYAFDAASGAKKWAYRTGNDVNSSPAVAGGVVYVGSNDDNVYALDAASGAKKWAYRTSGPITSSPAVAGGVVYVGSPHDGLYALDAVSGVKKWVYWPGIDINSSPAVAGGVVYVGSADGILYALDAASGAKKWAYYTGDSSSTPVVADGVVYAVADCCDLYAFHLPKRDPSSNGTARP